MIYVTKELDVIGLRLNDVYPVTNKNRKFASSLALQISPALACLMTRYCRAGGKKLTRARLRKKRAKCEVHSINLYLVLISALNQKNRKQGIFHEAKEQAKMFPVIDSTTSITGVSLDQLTIE